MEFQPITLLSFSLFLYILDCIVKHLADTHFGGVIRDRGRVKAAVDLIVIMKKDI